jgi:response regulator RpfG family c-di-GMP phosphodiesterase
MESKYRFLIIDDEPSIVLTIERLLNNSFENAEVFYAHNGETGLKLIIEKNPDVVITDVRMPGLTGLQILSELRSRKEFQDTYIILMSADTDRQMLLEALDKGADSFIYKPVRSDILIGKLKSAIRVVNIHKERKEEYQVLLQLAEEVEKYASDLIKLSVKFMEARIPASFKNLKIIAEASLWISQFFNEIDDRRKKDLEVAAYMSFSGRLSLPDSLINKPILIDGKASDNLMYQVPVAAKNIVSEVKRFERVGNILYHLYENMDGSGFPEKLQSWQIPLESRIIRVVVDFDDIVRFYKFRPSQALEKLRLEINRSYDHRIVTLLEQYVLSILKLEGLGNERPILLSELKAGMKLTRDIHTMNGLKILPAGAILNSNTIERIIQINTSDPIIGHIIVSL